MKLLCTSLRYVYAHGHKECTSVGVILVARRGYLDVIRFLQENSEYAFIRGADHALEMAAAYGHHHVVRFVHWEEENYQSMIDAAACGGQLRILKFLDENGQDNSTTLAMDTAAGKGFFPIVKYLCENRTEGCTKNAMDSAIRNKDLTMAKYLHEHYRVGFHEAALEKAVEKDPEDLGLVQAYLRPDVLKEEKTRAAFSEEDQVRAHVQARTLCT